MLSGYYHPLLVCLSVAVAVFASYTALDLAGRIRAIGASKAPQQLWLMAGAGAMGTGIWSMHFIGMLAFRLPIPLGYDARITAASFVIAVAVSYVALFVVTRNQMTMPRLAAGGLLMGSGIAGMHYTGMAAMQMDPAITYSPGLFVLSILIAMAAAITALWMTFRLRDSRIRGVIPKRIGSAFILGGAIAGMHYVGMSAANFATGSICGAANGINASWLAVTVGGGTLSVLVLTLVCSVLDSRFDLHTGRLHESLEDANQRLRQLATLDTLTGLPNRASLRDQMDHVIEMSQHTGRPFSVLFIDLDGFKAINDSLGHTTGDAVLKAFAQQLADSVRRQDTVARLGGDEFVALLEGLDQPVDVAHAATSMLARLRQDLLVNGRPMRVTPSIGIATYPHDGASTDVLLMHADTAMYDAKRDGRNTYRFFEPGMSEAAARILSIQLALSEALDQGQFFLVFQPKFSGSDGTPSGAEALLRWEHDTLGVVTPSEFIPIAERSGQIMQIGNWVIREACRHLRDWDARGLPQLKVALNLSPQQLRHQNYVDTVCKILAESDITPDRIMFEITETVAMQDAERTTETIHRFQELGFDVAIDDFGTGYSSLSYLQQFRVKQLKIDRFFTDGLDSQGEEGLAIVSAIIALAHSLKMNVVAEGVETATQLARLKSLACDQIQGFFLSKPLAADDFETFMLARGWLPGSESSAA
ncbi:MAG: putative bifunctional diguanylate cyclase/phosphodiesterase [Janthinobacterium lividum]